ncbi:hypothetical protein BDV95DRAFT_599523 [Massariosphaeria phaeospora]|uniref:Uncharacterized protein n=1 Tax=Massariosphaeria phaeospora TaxID=100035 RepID=A0A7C8M2T3_9PLEO|nr:hypothetical protein BDV95DRAFT_599523 [Massariosphaeria phaeospora]
MSSPQTLLHLAEQIANLSRQLQSIQAQLNTAATCLEQEAIKLAEQRSMDGVDVHIAVGIRGRYPQLGGIGRGAGAGALGGGTGAGAGATAGAGDQSTFFRWCPGVPSGSNIDSGNYSGPIKIGTTITYTLHVYCLLTFWHHYSAHQSDMWRRSISQQQQQPQQQPKPPNSETQATAQSNRSQEPKLALFDKCESDIRRHLKVPKKSNGTVTTKPEERDQEHNCHNSAYIDKYLESMKAQHVNLTKHHDELMEGHDARMQEHWRRNEQWEGMQDDLRNGEM